VTTDAVSEPTGTPEYRGMGVWPTVVAGLIVALAFVIFIAQNQHRISLHFLWVHFHTSPAVLVLVTALVAVAAAVLLGAVWRRRRRQVLSERAELSELRSAVRGDNSTTDTTAPVDADSASPPPPPAETA
jgi:uncharacterized integral membrane protein